MKFRTEQMVAMTLPARRSKLAAVLTGRGLRVDTEGPVNELQVHDAEGRPSKIHFGSDGSTSILTGTGRGYTLWHDGQGRLKQLRDPRGYVVELRHEQPAGSVSVIRNGRLDYQIEADYAGGPSVIRYPDKTETRYERGRFEQSVIDRTGARTRYDFNAHGNIRQIVDARG